ncbi:MULTISPECIES: hypothetical protein [Spirosoma]|uniref:Uncharacterized protein n=1 Tax=Spirosoma sordidisoli TaxID=2502893 RepID=A0A4V1RWC9_9BACT|nr:MULTISPECIES: hypothetical protein [Spirosoma]RYC69828.1 hypothetical protein EQG79_14640 [Spirosoma sordidisoli]
MSYDDLDINKRINLKGLVQAWQRITVDRFREDLNQKLYGRKRARWRRTLSRTYQLRNNWHMALIGAGDDVRGSQISFLQYGRFVDMGVGKGTDSALATYQRVRANGEKRTRIPVRWYSRRKGYETHRLRELLVQHHIDIPLETLESALSTRIELRL